MSDKIYSVFWLGGYFQVNEAADWTRTVSKLSDIEDELSWRYALLHFSLFHCFYFEGKFSVFPF